MNRMLWKQEPRVDTEAIVRAEASLIRKEAEAELQRLVRGSRFLFALKP